jgi:hypothetical protein
MQPPTTAPQNAGLPTEEKMRPPPAPSDAPTNKPTLAPSRKRPEIRRWIRNCCLVSTIPCYPLGPPLKLDERIKAIEEQLVQDFRQDQSTANWKEAFERADGFDRRRRVGELSSAELMHEYEWLSSMIERIEVRKASRRGARDRLGGLIHEYTLVAA